MADLFKVKLTIFFETPFWVGVFEREHAEKLEVSKVVFGPEPKDYEVFKLIIEAFGELEFSKPVEIARNTSKKVNPKKLQRAIHRLGQERGISTKAQEAIRIERESCKLLRKSNAKTKRDEEKKLKFSLKQEKRREKRRGH